MMRISLFRQRKIKLRTEILKQFKMKFEQISGTVLWDGEILQDQHLKETLDRLPAIVSEKGVSQLLSVFQLQ